MHKKCSSEQLPVSKQLEVHLLKLSYALLYSLLPKFFFAVSKSIENVFELKHRTIRKKNKKYIKNFTTK
tara:strand:+ start:463 stop:669 length:207 start_codon:yes stop_codon:yes gene_type:complete